MCTCTEVIVVTENKPSFTEIPQPKFKGVPSVILLIAGSADSSPEAHIDLLVKLVKLHHSHFATLGNFNANVVT